MCKRSKVRATLLLALVTTAITAVMHAAMLGRRLPPHPAAAVLLCPCCRAASAALLFPNQPGWHGISVASHSAHSVVACAAAVLRVVTSAAPAPLAGQGFKLFTGTDLRRARPPECTLMA